MNIGVVVAYSSAHLRYPVAFLSCFFTAASWMDGGSIRWQLTFLTDFTVYDSFLTSHNKTIKAGKKNQNIQTIMAPMNDCNVIDVIMSTGYPQSTPSPPFSPLLLPQHGKKVLVFVLAPQQHHADLDLHPTSRGP